MEAQATNTHGARSCKSERQGPELVYIKAPRNQWRVASSIGMPHLFN